MAMAIGVFDARSSAAIAILRLRRMGVMDYDLAMLKNEPNKDRSQSAFLQVSGYLESDARSGEIRSIQEGVCVALGRERVDRGDMMTWFSALDVDDVVILARGNKEQVPWFTETMRRAGARKALDSETQLEMELAKTGRSWKQSVREVLGVSV